MIYDWVLLAVLAVSPGQTPPAKKKPTAAQTSKPATTPVATAPDAGTAAKLPAAAPSGKLTAATDGGTAPSKPAVAGTPSDAGAPAAAKPARKPIAPDVKALVDRMQSFYEKTQDFSASFRQDYTYKQFKRTQTSSGKLSFKKPALMRWEYEKPSPKTFVLAGDKVYAHDPEAHTLTKAALGTDKLSASVTFLWGVGKLEDEFEITKGDCKSCKGTLLVLNPLVADSRFKRVLLEVDPGTAQVLKSTVVDPDGSENAISFIDLKTNTGVKEDAFKLNPPPGTQIVDMTKTAPTK